MFKKIVILIITMLICSSLLFGEKQIYVQAPILADFEDSGNITEWIMDRTSANIDLEVVGQDKKGAIKATEGGPDALFIPADKKKYCLGIKAAFRTMGYNFIEIRPPVYKAESYPQLKDLFINPIPNPNNDRFIPIPGRTKSIDVWVAGRNYRYNLEIHIQDFNGFAYALDMGKINFPGWRNLSRELPNYISQEEKHIPKERPLKFIKYVLRSDPYERADKFYIYLDHMKVLTDIYIVRYDGIDNIGDTW